MNTLYHHAAVRCLIYAAQNRLLGDFLTAMEWLIHARNFNKMKDRFPK